MLILLFLIAKRLVLWYNYRKEVIAWQKISNTRMPYSEATSRINTGYFHYIEQYPVITAMESRIKNFWNTAGAFYTVQDALQFYPFKEDGGRIHEIG